MHRTITQKQANTSEKTQFKMHPNDLVLQRSFLYLQQINQVYIVGLMCEEAKKPFIYIHKLISHLFFNISDNMIIKFTQFKRKNLTYHDVT